MAARALSAAPRTRCSNARSAPATCTSAPRSSPAARVAAASRGTERPAGRSHWGRSRARCCCCCCLGLGWAPAQVPPLAVALSTRHLLAGAAMGELGRPAGGQVVATGRTGLKQAGGCQGGGQVWEGSRRLAACLLAWQADDAEEGEARRPTNSSPDGRTVAATGGTTATAAAAPAPARLRCCCRCDEKQYEGPRSPHTGWGRTGCEGARCAGRLRLQPRGSVWDGLQKAGRAAEGGAGSARRARRCRNTLQDTRSQPEPRLSLFEQASVAESGRPPPETPLLGHCARHTHMRAPQAGGPCKPAQCWLLSLCTGIKRSLQHLQWFKKAFDWCTLAPARDAALATHFRRWYGRDGGWPCT